MTSDLPFSLLKVPLLEVAKLEAHPLLKYVAMFGADTEEEKAEADKLKERLRLLREMLALVQAAKAASGSRNLSDEQLASRSPESGGLQA